MNKDGLVKERFRVTQRAGIVLACALVVIAAITVVAVKTSRVPSTVSKTAAGSPACESCPSAGAITFSPTAPNSAGAPGAAPAGMVWIPGGEFSMGSTAESESLCGLPGVTRDALPVHRVYVDGFWMDKTELTNEEFDKFVSATGYVTIAERRPTKEEFPTAPPENLVAGSTVFTPTKSEVPLDDYYQWWRYVKGANWRHPEGPQSEIKGKEKFPVVQIAYEDAAAYA